MDNPPDIDFDMYIVVDKSVVGITDKEMGLLASGYLTGARFCPGCDPHAIRGHFNSFVGMAFSASINVVHYFGGHLIIIGLVDTNEMSPINDWV